MNTPIAALGLAAVLAGACVEDLRSRRIPNRVILAGLALALGWQIAGVPGRWTFDPVAPGSVGLVGGLAAFLAMLVAFLPFYALRIMGAGDVKLLAVVAAFFGVSTSAWTQLPGLALSVLVAGGLLALLRMVVARNAAVVLANVRTILVGVRARVAGTPGAGFDPATASADRMPYAFAILAGTVFYAGAKWSGWLKVL